MTKREWEPPHDTVDDAYDRVRGAEWVDHLQAVAEREREHRTDWKPARRAPRDTRQASQGVRDARKAWREAVVDRDQGCLVHTNPVDCGEDARGLLWVAHHVVFQQELRRSKPALLWHPLSGMCVCGLAHTQHHSRVRPIERRELPDDVEAFLIQSGYGWYLDRHYAAIGAMLRDGKA